MSATRADVGAAARGAERTRRHRARQKASSVAAGVANSPGAGVRTSPP
jgi:hypothetical protein